LDTLRLETIKKTIVLRRFGADSLQGNGCNSGFNDILWRGLAATVTYECRIDDTNRILNMNVPEYPVRKARHAQGFSSEGIASTRSLDLHHGMEAGPRSAPMDHFVQRRNPYYRHAATIAP